MSKLLIAAAAFGTAVFAMNAQPALALAPENCVIVTATADARNQQISTDRALRRLRRYIADELSSSTGKSVGPTTTKCIRNACRAQAIVCQH